MPELLCTMYRMWNVLLLCFREKQRLKEMQVKLKTADLAAELEDWCQLVDKQNKIVIYTLLQFFFQFSFFPLFSPP